ncbi:S8 family serine peptidase (plasmid) [Coraliomargarita sp. W4R53]
MSRLRVSGGIVAVGVVAALTLSMTGGAAVATDTSDVPDIVTLSDVLAEAAEAGADSAMDLSEAAGLPTSGPGSLTINDAGQISATVTFSSHPTEQQLASVALFAEIDQVFTFSPAVAVTVEPELLLELDEIDGVAAATPDLRPISGPDPMTETVDPISAPTDIAGDECRSFPAAANEPLRSDVARESFDVDGTGVTVGIISDSYALATEITTPEEDVAAGLLPGAGNPCGYVTPVEVIFEADEDEGGTDEGRAMAQLVHGIAPGAELLFAAGLGSMEQMAENIIALADAGADIIVDDLGFVDEPAFQQGILSAAIVEVQSRGVAFYAAAGNDTTVGSLDGPSAGLPINGWQTTQYEPTDCPAGLAVPENFEEYDCLDFDPGVGEDPTDQLGLHSAEGFNLFLNWAEPIGGVTSDFALAIYENDPGDAALSTRFSDIDPLSFLQAEGPDEPSVIELAVVRNLSAETAATPALRISSFGGSKLSWREHDTSEGPVTVGVTSFGHQSDGSGEGIGAAPWSNATMPEPFTSIGPAHIVYKPYDPFGPVAAAYPEPLTLAAPVVMGVDGLRTNFFGRTEIVDGEEELQFYGTSAAAPTVAAVHALAAEYAPEVDQDVIVEHMTLTAQEMTNPYAGFVPDAAVFGAGLVDANALLASLPAAMVNGVVTESTSSTTATVQWSEVAGAAGYRLELSQAGSVVSTGDVAADVTLVALDDLTALAQYSVRVAALNAAGAEGVWSEASEFTMPRPDQPTIAPTVPDASVLTPEATGGLVATPSTVDAGASVMISGLPANQWVYGWVFSSPVALGWSWSDASGTATFTVPTNTIAGGHQIAVSDTDSALFGWASVTVREAAEGESTDGGNTDAGTQDATTAAADLAVTGSDLNTGAIAAGALLVLLAGAILAVWARRKTQQNRQV